MTTETLAEPTPRRVDALLYWLEEINVRVWDRWLATRPKVKQGGHQRYRPDDELYPPPPAEVIRAIEALRRRYDPAASALVTTTTAAHEELLRLQGYLLPGGDRESDS